mmetsp:Transcript_28388/g.50715  ORF Transcript_28388/g.50715 Transcript_28388/m.50715 type:complete len:171 (+) Transcript_28388:240-752(+)
MAPNVERLIVYSKQTEDDLSQAPVPGTVVANDVFIVSQVAGQAVPGDKRLMQRCLGFCLAMPTNRVGHRCLHSSIVHHRTHLPRVGHLRRPPSLVCPRSCRSLLTAAALQPKQHLPTGTYVTVGALDVCSGVAGAPSRVSMLYQHAWSTFSTVCSRMRIAASQSTVDSGI